MKLAHLFLPHPDTHKKAHLLSSKALLIYILFFLILNFGVSKTSSINPRILGISTSITVTDLINLTNQERAKNGLNKLTENSDLDKAAQAKAQNMFQENYWAHYSPSGKDPWSFILAAGYKFAYAGENLAKNFHSASDVVQAWMNSPTHRENMVNPHYTDIGMAVATGTLQGEETVLVVQEFGSPAVVAEAPSTKSQAPPPAPIASTPPQELPDTAQAPKIIEQPQVAKSQILPVSVPPPQPMFDSFAVTRNISLALISFLAMLLVLDFVILKKRGVVRVSSHHLSHFALLGVAGATVAASNGGAILEGISKVIK